MPDAPDSPARRELFGLRHQFSGECVRAVGTDPELRASFDRGDLDGDVLGRRARKIVVDELAELVEILAADLGGYVQRSPVELAELLVVELGRRYAGSPRARR